MNNPYQKTTLNNGLRIITASMPYTRSVSTSFFIGTGSRYEADNEAGISHFVEHVLFKGTKKRPTAREIATAIEGIGGVLNGGTDKEMTVYWTTVTQHHFAEALDVLVDLLLNPKLDPPDIEKERQVIIEEINMSLDSPSQRVDMLIGELLWPNHPLGRDTAGTKETVAAISRDMMLNYTRRQYQPDDTVISIAGNIEHQEAVNAITEALGNWGGVEQHPSLIPYIEQPSTRIAIETRDTEQVHLCLGLPGLALLHPRRYVLDLLNTIFGDGMSSRLFTEIRENKGLAYSIASNVEHYIDTGAITVGTDVDPRNMRATITAIVEQFAQLKEMVPEAELNKAKEQAKGRLLLRMENSRNVSGWAGGQEILTGRILSPDDVTKIIDDITAEELKQLADELLIDSGFRLAVVGPVEKDEPLEELLRM